MGTPLLVVIDSGPCSHLVVCRHCPYVSGPYCDKAEARRERTRHANWHRREKQKEDDRRRYRERHK